LSNTSQTIKRYSSCDAANADLLGFKAKVIVIREQLS